MPSVSCPSCQKGYKVSSSSAGKKAACTECKTVFRISFAPTADAPAMPALAFADMPTSTAVMTAPAMAKSTTVRSRPTPPPLPVAPLSTEPESDDAWSMAPEAEEVYQPTPPSVVPAPRKTMFNPAAKPAKAKPARSFGFRFGWLTRVMLGGGIGLIIFGVCEWRLASVASDVPQKLTCDALTNNGYGDNAHIEVTEYAALGEYVYNYEHNESTWKTVYIPLIPLTDLAPSLRRTMHAKSNYLLNPQGFDSSRAKILMKSTHSRNEDDLKHIIDRGTIDGMIVNKIESLDSKDKELLSSKYPAMDLSNAYILEEGREPRGGLGGLGIIGGALLCLGAVANVFRPR